MAPQGMQSTSETNLNVASAAPNDELAEPEQVDLVRADEAPFRRRTFASPTQ